MESGVYMIKNMINGKFYIGSSVCIKERWRKHKSHLKNKYHDNSYLQNSVNKYGLEAFEFIIIEYCKDVKTHEQWWIDTFKPEYNLSLAATCPMLGRSHTEETKARMSKIHSERPRKPYTDEQKANVSKGHIGIGKGVSRPESVKNNISSGVAEYWRKIKSGEKIRTIKVAQ